MHTQDILGKQGNHAVLDRSSAAAYLTEEQKETAFESGMRVRANGLGVSQQTQRMLGASGNTGEKAKPYSQRGIQIEQRLQGYLKDLGKNGDYISVPSGEIRSSDLAVLTTETGVEFTIVKAAGKTFLIRGDEKYTTIPQELFGLILDSEGSIDCHSHPYIGDLIPSEADMQMMELLTWLDESTIIDPTEKTARFNSFGLVDMGMETNKRDASYYENMDWGGD